MLPLSVCLAYSLLILDHFRLGGLVRGESGHLGDGSSHLRECLGHPGRLLERLGCEPGSGGGGERGPGCGEGLGGGPELGLGGRQSGLLRGADDGGELLADGQAGVGVGQDLGVDEGLLGLGRGQDLALGLGLGSGEGHGLGLDLLHLREGR